jgi:CMP-N-acetylneuraminate monooxygenase
VNVPSVRLASVPVTVADGRLAAPLQGGAVSRGSGPPRPWPADLSIRLIGHACLEIACDGFKLLTDPWLSGPAFLGAWMPLPAPQRQPEALRPDAIWISHEHSDHFHVPTLARFARHTPIYVPDFPNGRIVRSLEALGFSRVCAVRFGQPHDIAAGVRVTAFEPPGLWNDSIVLFEVGGVRVLNINDAGVNHRIASLVGPVDVLASTFNHASSYPYAWSHLCPEDKARICERARLGMLRMLHQAVKVYRPRYLLPFASYFTLWHPSHREYVREMRRNTLDDVVRAFRAHAVEVLDMLPGGAWAPAAGLLDRGPGRATFYASDRWHEPPDGCFDQAVFETHHPAPGPLPREQVREYFLRLNEIPDIAFCEDLVVRVEATEGAVPVLTESFEIRAGELTLVDSLRVPDLAIQVPLGVLRHLVAEEASWDEAHVGFWCRFSRTPDVFHAGFWRLLQAPYFRRPTELAALTGTSEIDRTTSIARLIECYGRPAEQVLSRYGLHCSGCPHAPAESVSLAARRHGVDDAMVNRLVRELQVVLSGKRELARA